MSRSVLFSGLMIALVGCGPSVSPPDELFPAIEYVINNASDFDTDGTESLNDITPGTVRDELSTLDGCWGVFGTFVSAEDGSELSNYEVYQFDVAGGSATWQIYQETEVSVVGTVALVGQLTGTGEFDETDQVTVQFTQSIASDIRSGELIETDLENTAGTPGARTQLSITVDGDEMIINNVLVEDDAFSEDRTALVFKRFDCPTAAE